MNCKSIKNYLKNTDHSKIMKRSDELANYERNKRQIFDRLLSEIEVANSLKRSQIYVKNIKILEEEVDVIAKREEWPVILQKAMTFFENLEDYEMCQKCMNLQNSLKTKTKKKKSDGEKRTKEPTNY